MVWLFSLLGRVPVSQKTCCSKPNCGLAQAHCKRISLDTTQPLKRAIQFYLQNGYLPSGKVTDFFGMPLFEYVKILGR